MNALTKTSVASVPTVMPPMMRREVDFLVTKLDPPFQAGLRSYSMALPDAPSAEARTALEARKARIDGWMQPCGPDVATREYKLLCTMGVANTDDETAGLEMFSFVEAASRLPAFALQDACSAFRLGKIGDGKWMPKVGEVCREAERRVMAYARERLEIEAVLGAKIRSPQTSVDHRAEVAAKIRQATAGISMAGILAERSRKEAGAREAEAKAEAERVKAQAETARIAAMIAAGKPDDRPLPPLSPGLRSKYIAATTQAREAAE